MTEQEARDFATEWIDAWNQHDVERIASHYAETVEYVSAFVAQISGEPSGVIKGLPAVREYFARGLAAYPELHFELINVLAGVNSVVLYYHSVNNLIAAEFMRFDGDGKIDLLVAHYSS
jgi:hypothetical protein